MNMKKMLSLVLVSAMTLTMAATAFAEEAGGLSGANCDPANTAKTDETLTIGFGSEPSTLVGTATGNTENESMMIFSALTDNLVAYNSLTGEIEPQLATAWEWVDDKHCKFTLRDDVTMSDGTPFVADDVVFSVKMWRDQNATNETGSIFTECADPVADDEHTVTIEFTSNAPDIIRMLTWTNYGIVSEDEVNAAGGLEEVGKNPLVGSGPYKFVSWTNGQNVVIERNEEYWNQDYAGYYKQIVFTFTSDPAARIMAVQSGDADVAYAIPTAQANTFQGNEAVKVVNYTFDQVNHLWFNMGENAGVTADQKVREAIDKALNSNTKASASNQPIDEDNYILYHYFYYNVQKYPEGKTFFYKLDYNHIPARGSCDGVIYYDDSKQAYIVHAIYAGGLYDYKANNPREIKKIHLARCKGGLIIDNVPYAFQTKSTPHPEPALFQKEIVQEPNAALKVLSEIRKELFVKLDNMKSIFDDFRNIFLSDDDVTLARKYISECEKNVKELEVKAENASLLL